YPPGEHLALDAEAGRVGRPLARAVHDALEEGLDADGVRRGTVHLERGRDQEEESPEIPVAIAQALPRDAHGFGEAAIVVGLLQGELRVDRRLRRWDVAARLFGHRVQALAPPLSI